jgi:hypothetical protein
MFERSALLSLATASLLALAAPAARANPPPLDHPEEKQDQEKLGGNAIDRAASGLTAEDEPDDYEIDAYFWAVILGLDPEELDDSDFETLEEELAQQLRDSGTLSRGEPFIDVGGKPAPTTPEPVEAPELELLTDAPAESVLDQIDERQAPLPMVGEFGSTSAATLPAPAPPAETTAPPPESILDYLDSAPPQATQDPAKPAVNEAAPPQIVETKQ